MHVDLVAAVSTHEGINTTVNVQRRILHARVNPHRGERSERLNRAEVYSVSNDSIRFLPSFGAMATAQGTSLAVCQRKFSIDTPP